jgi:hypothetical protein
MLVAKESMKSIFTLLVGILIGIASMVAINLLGSGTTEVWKSQVDLKTSSGIVIPAGTEFVVSKYMPEGFVALSLGVNIEAPELNSFEKTTINKANLRIPVWAQKSN